MARRDFRQMSLVDQFYNIRPKRSEHLEALSKCIDWACVQKLLDAIYASVEGAASYPVPCYVRIMLLQQWYGLSDREAELPSASWVGGPVQRRSGRTKAALYAYASKHQLTRSSYLWPVTIDQGKTTLPVMKTELLQACGKLAPAEFTPAVADALAFVFDVLARSLANPDSAADALVRKNRPLGGNDGPALQDPGILFDWETHNTGNS